MNALSQALAQAKPELVAMSQRTKHDRRIEAAIHEARKGIRYGGTHHRFKNDAAIYAFCLDNSLDNPRVEPNGMVVADTPYEGVQYAQQTIFIGWIC